MHERVNRGSKRTHAARCLCRISFVDVRPYLRCRSSIFRPHRSACIRASYVKSRSVVGVIGRVHAVSVERSARARQPGGTDQAASPHPAVSKMKGFVQYFMRKPGAEVVKPTKTKLSSFASKNPTNKATVRKGRTSALKDTIANAYAGGREFRALMLNVGDELFTGGGLSVDRYVEMMTTVGSTVPYVMANAEGGEGARYVSLDGEEELREGGELERE